MNKKVQFSYLEPNKYISKSEMRTMTQLLNKDVLEKCLLLSLLKEEK